MSKHIHIHIGGRKAKDASSFSFRPNDRSGEKPISASTPREAAQAALRMAESAHSGGAVLQDGRVVAEIYFSMERGPTVGKKFY
jgi:hypothetical protein